MKRIFEIEWNDDFGPMWMNKDNLIQCLCTKEHVGDTVALKVTDITEELQKTHDLVVEIHKRITE